MLQRSAFGLRNPHDRDIARLAIPALGGLVAQPLYVLADTAIVGRLGTVELAGLAVASGVLFPMTGLLIFLAYGTTGLVGRLIGADDEPGAASQAIQSMWLAAGLGTIVAVGIGLNSAWFVGLFDVDAATATAADLYLTVSLWGTPAMLVVLAGTGTYNGRQDTRRPLVVAVIGAVTNLVIEIVAIIGLGFGLGASALATVIAQWLTAGLFVVPTVAWARSFGVDIRPRPSQMTALFGAGIPLIIRTAALQAAFTLSIGVAARAGTTAVAGYQIAIGVWTTLALALDAVAIAGQALTAKLVGAADRVAARSAADRMIVIDIGLAAIMALGLALVRGPLATAFSNDAAVVAAAALCFGWISLQLPINGLVFALDGILIGARDLRFLAVAMIGALGVFLVALAATSRVGASLNGVWAALSVFMVGRAVVMAGRYRTGRWLATT